MNRRFNVLDAKTTREAVGVALDTGSDWLLIRPAQGRYQLMRPGELERLLAEADPEDVPDPRVDLMNIPGQRADVYPIDARASLQEAYDQFEATGAEALVVQRTSPLLGRRPTPYGILTPAALAAAYRR
jgi:CIC family chloride channel protein